MRTRSARKCVYDFADGGAAPDLLGYEAASMVDLARLLGAELVPGGFTVIPGPSARNGRPQVPDLDAQLAVGVARVEQRAARRLGDARDPLLLSVRVSLPEPAPDGGDVAVDVGLNDQTVVGLAARASSDRFAWCAYQRAVRRFGTVVCEVPRGQFDEVVDRTCRDAGVGGTGELSIPTLQELTATLRDLCREAGGPPYPQDPGEQIQLAIRALLRGRDGVQAASPRQTGSRDNPVAIIVQQVVLGVATGLSARGVAFSRDELSGAPEPTGRFVTRPRDGADVALPLRELADQAPHCHRHLVEALMVLESRHERVQEVAFAIEDDRLYVLSTRAARLSPQAMIRFACDAVDEGMLTTSEALMAIDADTLDALLHPTFDPLVEVDVLARGVAASPGAATGEVVFTTEAAAAAAESGRAVILARRFADAGDVAGFSYARGVVTAEGGKTSHAAMVARGMGLPAVVGLSSLVIDSERSTIRCGDVVIEEFQRIAIDGGTGVVTLDDVPIAEASGGRHLARVLSWADGIRALEVRVNADTPEDAARALELGAEGIGVCRTEHMFLHEDRQEKMRSMIMARGLAERQRVLSELLPLQQSDFEGLFEVMRGAPVTIRLLDPPLHEFLPNPVELVRQLHDARDRRSPEAVGLDEELSLVLNMAEANPMLGTRGCRLGIVHPEIYEMQVEAMMRAARAVEDRLGYRPQLEVMIPLVDYESELEMMRGLVVEVSARYEMREGVDYTVGTMIELPRACFVAGQLAEHAEFFSFGTNDLTQTALGFSRDDVEADFFPTYIERGVFHRSPFQTIDLEGVGELLRTAVEQGRGRRPDIELGVCGEHGGDPASIAFFHQVGIDYVSCSTYRLPGARVAAAQAQLKHPRARTRRAATVGARTP